jgi:hypothetical protein
MFEKIPILLVSFFMFLFLSCSTSNKIGALKPAPDDASPLTYQ